MGCFLFGLKSPHPFLLFNPRFAGAFRCAARPLWPSIFSVPGPHKMYLGERG